MASESCSSFKRSFETRVRAVYDGHGFSRLGLGSASRRCVLDVLLQLVFCKYVVVLVFESDVI